MYRSFFEDRTLIPEGQFCEIAFEELEENPLREIATIYESLNIKGFHRYEPALRDYVASVSNYQKNRHPPLPPQLRQCLAKSWQQSFQEWGYLC